MVYDIMVAKSFYLEQLKKKTSLYPLGKDDPKKKLGLMEQLARQAQSRGKPDKINEVKEVVKSNGNKWKLKS